MYRLLDIDKENYMPIQDDGTKNTSNREYDNNFIIMENNPIGENKNSIFDDNISEAQTLIDIGDPRGNSNNIIIVNNNNNSGGYTNNSKTSETNVDLNLLRHLQPDEPPQAEPPPAEPPPR